MAISKNHTRLLKTLIVIALILVARPMFDSGRSLTESAVDIFHFSGRTVVCCIDLGADIRDGHGLECGFTYEILQDFARDHNCKVDIVIGKKGTRYVDSLAKGTIDLLVMHHEDTIGNTDLILTENLLDCCAIAFSKGKEDHVREVNEWITEYTSSDRYQELKSRFFRPFNPKKRAEKGVRSQIISPYDDLLKKYAKELGWDWRMLAAVVYQESKFSICAQSHRGATGLMQVMPQTGAAFNITDLNDPEQNLIAGTTLLKRLQRIYRNANMSNEERTRFILASYNAGAGRIKDCRNLARSKGLNPNVWNNVVKVIPLMRDDSILDEESIRLGKFNGSETIAYVENVDALYKAICKICPR